MKKKNLILFVFTFVSFIAFSQTATLKVKVIDENSNPIFNVNVTYFDDIIKGEVTNNDGITQIEIPANKKIIITFSNVNYHERRISFNLKENFNKEVVVKLKEKINIIPVAEITHIQTRKKEQLVDIDVKQTFIPSPSNDISTLLEFQSPGIHKNNELSTAYSVRGGNFDENLVYVNGFEIYRPFLIRSGQQEGLSFVNPDMVQGIAFSAGGFQAKYGDKMSSILDVTYKRPRKFGGSVAASLLGVSAEVEGVDKNKRFTYTLGVRYKTSKLLLGALEVKGEYTPSFVDLQGFFTYKITDRFHIEYISNFAMNKFDFIPEDRTTDFGLVNFTQRFRVFYDNGSAENDKYNSLMNGLAFVLKPTDKLKLKFLASSYNMAESERFDLLGEYFLGEVETDPSKDNAGLVKNVTGSGAFHDWARNKLYTDVFSLAHKGKYKIKKHDVNWGLTYKHEIIEDRINEWVRIDSAGYNLPYTGSGVVLHKVLKPKPTLLVSNRYSAYLQDSWYFGDTSRLYINYGARMQYWDINKKVIVSPRVQLRYLPNAYKGFLEFKAAAGLYFQQPFYREMKNLEGEVNTNLKPQKSAHFILGVDYSFKAWDREFRFITEGFYKYLWDNVPYKYDNVLIRYYGTNNSKGYVAGVDFRLNGELAKGLESWVSLSVMSAEEDILDDYYTTYEINKTKEDNYGVITDVTDTVNIKNVYPGYIAKPSDQRVRFALFFQDYIPKYPFLKVHLNLVIASGLPYGPPDSERYNDKFRMRAYKRFDIGFSASLYNKKLKIEKNKPIKKHMEFLESVWVSFEVFNVFAIKNVASYSWVEAYDSRTQTLGKFAIPNYLTDRRLNLKLRVDF